MSARRKYSAVSVAASLCFVLLAGGCAGSGSAVLAPVEPYRVQEAAPRASVLEALGQPDLSSPFGGGRVDAFRHAASRRADGAAQGTTDLAGYLVFYDPQDRVRMAIQTSEKTIAGRIDLFIQCGARQGREAASIQERCVPVIESLYRSERAQEGAKAMELANRSRGLQDYERAEPLYEKALAIAEELHGADSRAVADVLKEYAVLLRASDEPADAKSMEDRVQEILAHEAAAGAGASRETKGR